MASLKPVLKNYFVKESGKSTIFIRISHDGKTRYIKTPWEIESRFMNQDGTINGKYPGQAKLNLALYSLLSEYNGILDNIGKDIINIDINTLTNKLRRHQGSGEGFMKYIKERIKILRSEKRFSYAGTYEATIKHLKDFTNREEILFKEINLDFLNRFERHLATKGKRINTIRIYLNNIRTVFNHAIDNDIIKQELFPFRKFKVKEEMTMKRNLDVEEIKKLLSQNLSLPRQRALDLFMLSFYLLGINFKDLLFLTPENLFKGRIEYIRAKTGTKLSVKMQPEALRIIDKYKGEKYLLRFMDYQNPKRKTVAYMDVVKETNKLLKKICKKAEMDIPLSTYYARHSIATLAYNMGIQESTISEILGHKYGSRMTNIYIERDTKRIDEAQRMIIDSLK